MNTRYSPIARRRNRRRRPIRIVWLAAILGLPLGAPGCGHLQHLFMGRSGVERPPVEAFGLGLRTSEGGLYQAVLDPGTPLRPREMRTIQAVVQDAHGRPLDGLLISVDGGMPEHDHGLPTRPRAAPNGAPGTYDIEGVRFNMGGWWEFRLRIEGPAGTDTVTFNLDL